MRGKLTSMTAAAFGLSLFTAGKAMAAAPILAVLLAISTTYGAAKTITGDVDTGIAAACAVYTSAKTAAEASIAAGAVPAIPANQAKWVEYYGDTFCSNPPTSGDPLANIIWLGKLTGQLATLTAAALEVPNPSLDGK